MPASRTGYTVLAVWLSLFGMFLMAAPDDWLGPSWSYFATHNEPIVPAGGFGMGLCLILLGGLELFVLWLRACRWLPPLFFLAGFVFLTSGLLLGAEGLLGHQGLIEAPCFISMAVYKFAIGAHIDHGNMR